MRDDDAVPDRRLHTTRCTKRPAAGQLDTIVNNDGYPITASTLHSGASLAESVGRYHADWAINEAKRWWKSRRAFSLPQICPFGRRGPLVTVRCRVDRIPVRCAQARTSDFPKRRLLATVTATCAWVWGAKSVWVRQSFIISKTERLRCPMPITRCNALLQTAVLPLSRVHCASPSQALSQLT